LSIFEIGFCQLFVQNWLPTLILLLSAFWVARCQPPESSLEICFLTFSVQL
jgi:hypothetical protein